MSARPLSLAAAFVAGLAGAGTAVALAGALGAFSGSTTTVVAAPASARTSAPPPQVVADIPAGRFDSRRIYRERSAGVVTISAEVGADDVSGSGFVISPKGYVITNAHVISNSPDDSVVKRAADVRIARRVFVRFFDGNSLPATIVGVDLFDDVAVLKVDPTREPLTVLSFGGTGALHVGDPLAVIGSPFGTQQEQSLSVGVISALGRDITAPAVSFATPNAIQTDAAINHGNSGGPVFDARGRVIGVAAQIQSTGGGGEGVAFAIPAEAVKRSYEALIGPSHKVHYAWFGVSTRPISRELARQFDLPVREGLIVDEVHPGGPAALAGLSAGSRTAMFQDDHEPVHPEGDIIVSFDGHDVRTSADLSLVVALAEPGTVVPVVILRAGKRRTVRVTLGDRPPNL
jgi:S1-C subfamily serine protease